MGTSRAGHQVTFASDNTLDWNAIRTSARPFDIAHPYPAATGTRCTMSLQASLSPPL